MRSGLRLSLLALLAFAAGACDRAFTKQYEYHEQIDLGLDGSATVIVSASIPALVALRGFDLDPDPRARLDRARVRAAYDQSGVRVIRVSRPWRRHGRRFVQVRLAVDDIRRLGRVPAFAWATYTLTRDGDAILYRQTLGPAAGGAVGDVGWRGDEIVAFRAHMPSRVLYHNVRDLERGTTGSIGRGNILAWEQRLADRRRGVPLVMEARLEARSILRTTLWVFVLSGATAAAALITWIVWMIRQGRRIGSRTSAPRDDH